MRPADIVSQVAEQYGYTVDQLTGPRRFRRLVWARQRAMLELRRHTCMSLEEIGGMFGRDHSTVWHGIREAAAREGAEVPPAPVRPVRPVRRCEVHGCRRRYRTNGMCDAHKARWVRHGDVFADVPVGELVTAVRDVSVGVCVDCGSRSLAGGRWCGVGRCTASDGRWSWSRRAA